MSFVGFLRILFVPALATAVIVFLIMIAFHIARKENDGNTKVYLKVRNYSVVTVVGIFALSVIFLAATNLFPRATIDRTSVDKQTQQWEQLHSTPTK
jgi:multisubunit Na+/H+ antiporter MnhB subunit